MDNPSFGNDINRFELGIEILARLEKELSPLPEAPGYQEPLITGPDETGPLPYPSISYSTPDLNTLLGEMKPVDPYSVVVGVCEDGLPMMLDIQNSSAGSLLITGNQASNRNGLMQSILESACISTPARKLRITCFADHANHYPLLAGRPHCYHLSSPYQSRTREILSELIETAEQRKYSRAATPVIILAIDDLYRFIGALDSELLNDFCWLVQDGSASQIWTIASVDSSMIGQLPPQIIHRFGTWLVGSVNQREELHLPQGRQVNHELLESLIPGCQFMVRYGSEWIPIWVPRAA